MIDKRRWLIALAIIAIIIAICAAIIVTNRPESTKVISLQAVSDNSGGAIAGWYQDKNFSLSRISSDGIVQWSNDDFFKNIKGSHGDTKILGDGRGGAFIKWSDNYNKDVRDPAYFESIPVYIQKIGADGKNAWKQEISAGSAGSDATNEVIADGSGGIILLWNDYKTVYKALHDDYYRLQRIDPDGNNLWGDEGILIYSSPPFHPITPEEKEQGIKGSWTRAWPQCSNFRLFSDNSGGVIVIWTEEMQSRQYNLFAQRYNAAGKPAWGKEGIFIYGGQELTNYSIYNDGTDLFMLLGTGRDESSGSSKSLIMQKLSADGNLLFGERGVEIKDSIATSFGYINAISIDPQKYIFTWLEGQGGPQSYTSIQMAAINTAGETIWVKGPLVSTTEPGQMINPLAIYKDPDAIFLIWRSGRWDYPSGKIFMQRLSYDGEVLGATDRSPLFKEFSFGEITIPPDPSGGVLIIGVTGDNPIYGNSIYALKLNPSGEKIWERTINVSH